MKLLPIYVAWCALAIAADDPVGWTAAKWGMTVDQVRAAVPDAAAVPPEKFLAPGAGTATLGVPRIDIGRTAWRVYFVFTDGALSAVHLKSTEPSAAAFIMADELLAQKYGRPMERREQNNRTSQWTFARTIVELRYVNLTGVRLETLWLSYTQPAATRL